jgi:mannose-6-phosphate isomerase-like protein (cupin superfamily)
MLKKIAKKMSIYLLIFIACYLVIGNLLHRVIFPESTPDIASYFKPNQQFCSKTEGFRQTVVKQENGFVYCKLDIEPFAGGPPKHLHTDFDETFEIENGELTIWVDGKIKKIHPGEVLFIPKGTPHQPSNETGDTIHTKGSIAFPEKFAFNLTQVYALVDNDPSFVHSPKALLQIALFTNAGFDSYQGDGPPVFMQKFMSFLIAPAARLLGYRSYYKKYDLFLTEK